MGYDYITIIDQDDCFYSITSLQALAGTAIQTEADIISSKICYESTPYNFGILDQDDLWDHGCLYSCSFLKENNIRFPDNHHSNDIAFNFWCNSIKDVNRVEIDEITYAYNYYSESLNHINNDEYKSNNMRQLMANFKQVFEEMQLNDNYSEELAKYHIRMWFLKYWLIVSHGELNTEKYDLWRSLPIFMQIFSSLLFENEELPLQEYLIIYKDINWNELKNELPLFSFIDFITLIKSNYLPEIE